MGDLVDLTKALEARRVAIPEGGELDIIYRTSEVLELGDRQFTEGWKACVAANATLRADRDALAARVTALETCLLDLATYGLRCDLTPTIHSQQPWAGYDTVLGMLRSADAYVRRKAKLALATPAPGATPVDDSARNAATESEGTA